MYWGMPVPCNTRIGEQQGKVNNLDTQKEVRQIEEKILKICMKLFWPVLIAWIICALAKIMIDFGMIA